MSKRFATVAVAIALAWQVGPVMAGPCDGDSLAKQAKAETAVESIKAEVAVVQVKAETAVEPIKVNAPLVKQVKVETIAEPKAEASVKMAKAVVSEEEEEAGSSLKNAPDSGQPMEARAVTERPKVVGRGNRSGLTSAARALLARIENKFGPVNVISGYRAGARIAGTGRISRHASGNAVDFDAGGRKGAIVKWLIANHKSGGTMTYSDMSHIHVDIGQHFVSLGANSRGGGRRSSSRRRYSERGSRYQGRRYSNQRRYSNERRSGNGSGYARRSSGRSYASGYATIYR